MILPGMSLLNIKLVVGLIFIVIVSPVTLAQFEENADKLYIGLGGSCHVSLFENYAVDSIYTVVVNSMRERERIRLSYAFQIPIKWQFSKYLSLSTGVQLYQYGYRSVMKDEVLIYDTVVSHNDTASLYYKNAIFFLDIPAALNISFLNTKKWSLFTEAGLSGCLFLFEHSRVRAEFSDGRVIDDGGFTSNLRWFKEYYFTINAGIGANCSLSEKLSLRMSANYKRFVFFFPLDNDEHQIKRVPYTLGLNVMLLYRIK